MGKKAYFVAIPTSSGTGSEVTPFAIITDRIPALNGRWLTMSFMPDMAIVIPTT